MTTNEKQAMSSAYKAEVEKYGTPISGDLYKELREYANAHMIRLSGFKHFVGDIQTIKTVIDDIIEIAGDFPSTDFHKFVQVMCPFFSSAQGGGRRRSGLR